MTYFPIPLGSLPESLGPEQAERYRKRIGAGRGWEEMGRTLDHLQHRHLLSVPFSTLDLHAGIVVDLPVLYDRIVVRKRGGVCVELNLLFAWLLDQVGFEVALARSTMANGWEHLLVVAGWEGEQWLVDVGYGLYAPHTIALASAPTHGRNGAYRVLGSQREGYAVQRECRDGWRTMTTWHGTLPLEAALVDLAERPTPVPVDFHSERRVEILLEDGRAVLVGDQLTVVRGTSRSERTLSPDGIAYHLEHLFDIPPL